MEQILIGGIFAFLVTFYAIPVIINIAQEKKLYDLPNERKIHKIPISSLGGIGIYSGFVLSLFIVLAINHATSEFQYYLAAFFIIFFLGVKDDLVVISPLKKFIGQLLVATILIFKGHLLIGNMHGFFGINELDPTSSCLLTYFTMIVVINAFNLIDGIDGLAGTLGMISCCIFGSLFFVNGNVPYAILSFTLAGSLLGFLIYNYQPAKIFMGDTGSMLIGLVNVILVIKFIEIAPSFHTTVINSAPAVGFGILLLPLMDTLRVFSIRIFHRRSPFSPDRNHVHHLLLDRGMSHRNITFSIAAASMFFAVIAFVAQPFGSTLLIIFMAALFFSGICLLYLNKPRYQLRVINNIINEPAMEAAEKDMKLVTFFSPAINMSENVEEASNN
ncbi:MAG: undecaprenyl-phosphate N-acetylglucosaminyl 1-phosphate transferase [Chitinophagaceae bacterium]|nr:undecaprenyl-phosphate N-acetylglucosaminyl 1-phosphate transferase [Chitinophagaceae bacterium]